MKKIFENIFKTRTDINFVSSKKFHKIKFNPKYQVVEFLTKEQWRKKHELFSVRILPTNFKNEYQFKLDKRAKIILFGNWRKLVYFYRILKFNGYNVYLCKGEKNEKK